MSSFRAPIAVAAVLAAAAVLAGCLLIAGQFHNLTLTFATQRAVEADEALEVHSSVYSEELKLRKFFVRIAGLLIPAEGADMPSSIDVSAVNEDLETGKVLLRFKMSVKVSADGSFSAVKRYRKDIPAGTLQTVTVTPRGAGIPNGSQITVCVDAVKSRGDLADRPCIADDPSGGSGDVFTVRILDNRFDPSLVRVDPGDTVRWLLEGSATNHTVTEMEMVFDSGLTLTQSGSSFEWTATEAHRDQTFGYACVTHQGCCQMTGSIQVGRDAPDPGDGY